MEAVGIRELKANLSRYTKRVRSGERIIVTERKMKIAVISPCDLSDREEKVYHMIQCGKAEWDGGKPKGIPNRIAGKGKSISEAVIEDRR